VESALARPRNKWAYEPDSDLAALAAAYGYGLGTNHGYKDGNKRVAFMAMYVFLGLNDWEIGAPVPEVVLALADGRLDEERLRLATGPCRSRQIAYQIVSTSEAWILASRLMTGTPR
jgi:death-on-curing protein